MAQKWRIIIVSKAWDFPGSKWWKCDFHIHTPQSNDYGRGNQSIKQMTTEEVWLRSAMQAKLDCVVVADHNDGGWIDRLKEKYRALSEETPLNEWFRELIIFPGVEITVADSSSRVHLLAIFDPSEGSQKIFAALGACGIFAGFGDHENTSTNTGFVDTVKRIQEAGGIAIPAHIDGRQGLLDSIVTLTPELEKSLGKVAAAEFCDVNKFDDSNSAISVAVNKLAKLAGSDAHFPEDIGRYFSWIKMGEPSLNGLQLAISEYDYCIINQSENPNQTPDIYITNLSIKSMNHCGRISASPYEMNLHPRFNAVIGGRGTGKSTTLESIRIVTRREKELKDIAKVKDSLSQFVKASSDGGVMLQDAEVVMGINRRGERYRCRWRYDGNGPMLEKEMESGWEETEAGNILERFPLSIFSQKQINELASNPKGLLELIDRSPQVDRSEWQGRWELTKSQFLQWREKHREIRHQLTQESDINTKLKDVDNDLKQYAEKGHGDILDKYQSSKQQLGAVPLEEGAFSNLITEIKALAEKIKIGDFPDHAFTEQNGTIDEVKEIHNETLLEIEKIQQDILFIGEKIEKVASERKIRLEASQWYQSAQSNINKYELLAHEYEDKKSYLDFSLYGQWILQRDQLQQQMEKIKQLKKEEKDVVASIEKVNKEFIELNKESFDKREKFIKEVIGQNRYVKMELIPYGDSSTVESEYRSILGLEEGKFSNSILDIDNRQGLLFDFFNLEKAQGREVKLSELINEIKQVSEKTANGEMKENNKTFATRLQKMQEKDPTCIDRLLCWWPQDLLRVKYSRNPQDDRFDNLEKGSAGQKAAAILAFLLSYGNEPLIIDQPEDDLDNALIYDLVVKQIKENKIRRQLFIVTHNPNIVVNGDAELVHVLKYKNGQVQIEQQGGLEDAAIRTEICTIMEGGREALEKRYKRMTYV